MVKSPEAFRTISEVADWLGVPAHALRFWESKFTQIKPTKRAGGRRYYRPGDMRLVGGIKRLLHDDGLTIRGVQKVLRERGVRHVAELSPPLDADIADAPGDAAPAEVALLRTIPPVAVPDDAADDDPAFATGPGRAATIFRADPRGGAATFRNLAAVYADLRALRDRTRAAADADAAIGS